MNELDAYLNDPAPAKPEYREPMKSPHELAANKFKNNRALNPKGAQDGNFTPKGFEQTPVHENTMVPRDTDPKMVAGMDDEPDVSGLMGTLAGLMGKLTKACVDSVQRTGGLPRLRPSVARKNVTTKGIRGMDAAERRKVQDAAHASDRAYLDAVRALHPAFEEQVQWLFDPATGLTRPVRPESARWA